MTAVALSSITFTFILVSLVLAVQVNLQAVSPCIPRRAIARFWRGYSRIA